MKKLYRLITVLYVLLVLTPGFAGENNQKEQSEALLECSDIAASSSGDILTDGELEEPDFIDTASDTLSLQEETKEKNPWAENVTGKELNTLRDKLEQLQELYNINLQSYSIAEAINSVEKSDSSKKRNNLALSNSAVQSPFSIYSSLYIFPELLEIYTKELLDKLQKRSELLVDEITDTPEEIQNIISAYAAGIAELKTIADAYKLVLEKAQRVIEFTIKKNADTSNLSSVGYYTKNSNLKVFNLLKEQVNDFSMVVEQFEMAQDYCQQQYDFMTSNPSSIAVKGKYIAEIKGSIKDALGLFRNYKYKQEFRFHSFKELYKTRYNDLVEKVGKEEIKGSRIRKYIKDFSFALTYKKQIAFDVQEDLDKVFELFGLKEADEELLKTLMPFVNSELWQSKPQKADLEQN